MLKRTIDSRKGWEFEVETRPVYIKALAEGIPVIPAMRYDPSYIREVPTGQVDVTMRAENKYVNKVIELENPRNWNFTRVVDPETFEFKYATFSWESE